MNIRPLAALALSVIASSALPAHAGERKCGAGSCSKKAATTPVSGAHLAEASCSRKESSCSKKEGAKDASCSRKEAAKDASCSKKDAGCSKKDGAAKAAATATPAAGK